MSVRQYLKDNILVCDGAFGTYYSASGGKCDVAEQANFSEPEKVVEIHREYIEAGAGMIRTNTFASNEQMLGCDMNKVVENIKEAVRLAKEAVGDRDVFVAGDIGPLALMDVSDRDGVREQYRIIASTFVEEKVDLLMFETFSSLDDIVDVIKDIKKDNDIYIHVQFCVNQYGYTNSGRSAKRLVEEASQIAEIDGIGFNCGVGPSHLKSIMEKIAFPDNKYISAVPNAGYPKIIQNRIVFMKNSDYFAEKESETILCGANIVGGCCGTTPEYIKKLSGQIKFLDRNNAAVKPEGEEKTQDIKNESFMKHKKNGKFIAVELAPPLGEDDEKIIEAANRLKNSGVDVLTFPDSPSGRTRADSILMAAKVRRATGMCVMPHVCCRDKNAIAARAQFLGAYMNDVYNFLILTGDPVPTMLRQNVKAVFNFDSVGLMKILGDMNIENFSKKPVTYGGVINYDKLNFDVEIRRVKTKMEAGATFFFTQPVFTKEDADKIKYLKEETGATVFVGIMPLVSRKNAIFIKNEMTGIRVTDEIVDRFSEEFSREENEKAGVAISREIVNYVADYTDGYYFTFPFNRVYLLDDIMG